MGLTVHSVETFDPKDLALLRQVYRDAWSCLAPLAPEASKLMVQDAVAVAIFDMARLVKVLDKPHLDLTTSIGRSLYGLPRREGP